VSAGTLAAGDRIMVLPSGRTSIVERIVTQDGDLERAVAGQAVTVTLADQIDIGRGDVIAPAEAPCQVTDQFAAQIIWMSDQPLLPERSYLMRIGTQTVPAVITELKHKVNVNTLEHVAGKTVELNEIAVCNVALDRAIAYEPYALNRDLGGFVLIDRVTNATVGAGMISFGLRRATNLVWQELHVDKGARARMNGQAPCVLWFTGLSGSGKSTIANLVEKRLHADARRTYVLDGDNVRHGLNKDLGFTDVDRVENIRRVAEVSRLMVDAGLIVLVSFISPFRGERRMARDLMEDGEFLEIFVDTPLEICEARDPKGLYGKARAGDIKNFTGIDSPYETPENAEIVLDTTALTPEDAAERVIAALRDRRIIA
jgi:bifunctional enzyme CysN/CysC